MTSFAIQLTAKKLSSDIKQYIFLIKHNMKTSYKAVTDKFLAFVTNCPTILLKRALRLLLQIEFKWCYLPVLASCRIVDCKLSFITKKQDMFSHVLETRQHNISLTFEVSRNALKLTILKYSQTLFVTIDLFILSYLQASRLHHHDKSSSKTKRNYFTAPIIGC